MPISATRPCGHSRYRGAAASAGLVSALIGIVKVSRVDASTVFRG